MISFDIGNEADQSGTVVQNLRPAETHKTKVFIPVFKFDEVLPKLNVKNISLIKINVEGAALEVLYGMEKVLKELKPIKICEIL